MAKILYPYNGLSASQIVAKASNTCTLTVSGTQVNCIDISTARIKSVIGSSSNAVSTLCTSGSVNKWSGFSPREFYISGNVVYDRPKTPYTMGSFAGYNHSAGSPFSSINPVFNLPSGQALQQVDINFSVNISEANFTNIYSYCHIVVDGEIVNSFELSTYNPLQPKDVTITTTAPYQGGTKTLNISVWLGTVRAYVGQLLTLAKSTIINVGVAPVFANMILVDSAANRAAIANKCGNGDEYCYYAEIVSNNRTVDSANLYGNYIVSAVLYNSNGTYSRTIEVDDRVLRTNISAYKINGSNTSSTYSIVSNTYILNDGLSFNFTIPSALLPTADNDRFYLIFDTLH